LPHCDVVGDVDVAQVSSIRVLSGLKQQLEEQFIKSQIKMITMYNITVDSLHFRRARLPEKPYVYQAGQLLTNNYV